MADVVERLRAVTEDDAYANPWTFGETCREAATEIETLRALSQAGAGGGVVRAWMRRWAYDNIDVMTLKKADRPKGWGYFAVTADKLLDDDAPLVAALAPSPSAPPGHTDLMVTPESIDAFLEANPPPATPVQPTASVEAVAFPAYGEMPFSELGSAVKAAQFGSLQPYEFDPEFYPGHQIVGTINFNSLNRIVTWFVKRALASLTLAPTQGDWPHVANEWADSATSGLQWLKNIRDGISTPEDAIASMEASIEHCMSVRPTTPSSPVSAPSPAGEDPRWQKLRDMLGLDGWHDGHFNGLPNPDQIVTHVQHVANERARLLLAPSPAGGDLMSDSRLDMAWADGAKAAMNAMSDFLPDAPAVREMDRIISQRQTDAIAGRKSAKPNPSPPGEVREALRAALEAELGDSYDCMRVWEAWHVGTMTEDDFTPVSDRLDEIADTVMAALSSPPEPVSAPANGEALSNWLREFSKTQASAIDRGLLNSAATALSNHAPGHGLPAGFLAESAPAGARWLIGSWVHKIRGSIWRGRVCGFYVTENTPIGYAVESFYEKGSVQVWPEAALGDWTPPSDG